ncbi:MAG: hypothetical protein Tsb0014_36060 [Pleurocapsa sp.]
MVTSVELIITIAAIVIIWIVFSWSIQVLKVSIKTALTLGAILIILQIVFGIKSQEIWQETGKIIENIGQFIGQYL